MNGRIYILKKVVLIELIIIQTKLTLYQAKI
ncbi:hypothetical protein SAMN03097699_0748 [Flavobacteriaceae bacterium MAR_2010_188]|nr:hypothetical protein SAMN03097699_0748 [Flavobacteriaceae bacterium MAR_2010_188]